MYRRVTVHLAPHHVHNNYGHYKPSAREQTATAQKGTLIGHKTKCGSIALAGNYVIYFAVWIGGRTARDSVSNVVPFYQRLLCT